MKPYLDEHSMGSPKFNAEKTDHVPGTAKGISKKDKLVTKNANRSRKKAARRQGKNYIKDNLKD